MNIDEMLAAPLPEAPDNGFSNRVMAEITRAQLRRESRWTWLLSICIAALCLLMPFTPLGREIGDAASAAASQYIDALSMTALSLLIGYAAANYARC